MDPDIPGHWGARFRAAWQAYHQHSAVLRAVHYVSTGCLSDLTSTVYLTYALKDLTMPLLTDTRPRHDCVMAARVNRGSGLLGCLGLKWRRRAVDFLIMEGQNLSAIAPSFVPFGGALGSARQAWVFIAAMVMLPTVYLRNLGLLAYLSAAGVLTSVSLTCLVGTIASEHGEFCDNSSCEVSEYVPTCLL